MRHICLGVAALGAAVGMAAVAEAGPVYNFTRIGGGGPADVAGQLTMEIQPANGGRHVDFIFRNTGSVPSSIVGITLDDGSLLNTGTLMGATGEVNFGRDGAPAALPGGDAVDFNMTMGLGAAGGGESNGINPGESLTIRFDRIYGQSPYDAVGALGMAMEHPGVDMDGGLRVGLVVQGVGVDWMDAFINSPVVVSGGGGGGGGGGEGHSAPLPSAGAMGLIGLLAIAGRRNRRPA